MNKANKRRETDVMKLMMSDYEVHLTDESKTSDLDVKFHGPKDKLVNIFDMFIPQLLRYPNPSDPLNGEAASLLMKDAESYNRKVKEYVRNYASQPIEMGNQEEDSDVSDMSDIE
ncbi:ubiquitin-conjugating enzyme E2, putative [Phytophthora infestans T30-4]|uniref:Ubiquitin-conjugating enzyme E2, putative n=1 Tax=Phytophthora infestans (strain T30-4) TaxID=403677 RepID=D0P452_PHYIT|nr:ubiquitin-conjugating enzyme E2, putative [Phytophthora infestans T30-4]EEY63134.1 ubiquitin-conjugating enzyme E2, putative [Phytophthora infestans T30-4]|eukprot:XP_002894916.1 ubiquitin-conjugating enzyme E2, putative [Phytophthora infestans T30-4]